MRRTAGVLVFCKSNFPPDCWEAGLREGVSFWFCCCLMDANAGDWPSLGVLDRLPAGDSPVRPGLMREMLGCWPLTCGELGATNNFCHALTRFLARLAIAGFLLVFLTVLISLPSLVC